MANMRDAIMNMKRAVAVAGAVVAMSLMANPVIAQQAEAGKPRQKSKGPLKVFILAGQSNMQGWFGVSTFDSMADDPKTAPIGKAFAEAMANLQRPK